MPTRSVNTTPFYCFKCSRLALEPAAVVCIFLCENKKGGEAISPPLSITNRRFKIQNWESEILTPVFCLLTPVPSTFRRPCLREARRVHPDQRSYLPSREIR